MKKEFKNPEMRISNFNIITTNDTSAVAQAKEMLADYRQDGNNLTSVITLLELE